MLVGIGNFLFRFRNGLFPLAFLLVFLPGRELFPTDLVAAAAGALVALAGQFVRAATIGLKYIVRGGKDRRVYAKDLVTEGLYGHTRNPMYVGNLLILTGVSLASNSLTSVAIAVPLFIFVYVAIVAAEENFLRGKFGAAFEAYCRDVPRWRLRLQGLGATLAGMEFHWKRVIVKEYGTPAGWILGISVVLVENLWEAGDGLAEDAAVVRWVLAIVTATALGWIAARILKKTKTLVAD